MDSQEAVSAERSMKQYLDAWRMVNRDCALAKETISGCEKLILSGTEQMQCDGLILDHTSFVLDETFKYLGDGSEIPKECDLVDELSILENQISEKRDTLTNSTLKLNDMRKKLMDQSTETEVMSISLKAFTLLSEKQLRCNNELKKQTTELSEEYKMRDLQFTCKLIDVALELNATESRIKMCADAILALDCNNKQLTVRSLHRTHGFGSRFYQIACDSMRCVWVCIGWFANNTQPIGLSSKNHAVTQLLYKILSDGLASL